VLNVGERTNANGSKRFRDAMLARDWDTCTELAKEAVRAGSHVIDVCVDYTGADGCRHDRGRQPLRHQATCRS